MSSSGELLLHPLWVDTNVGRILHEVGRLESVLVAEDCIVHFPELTLSAGSLGGLGGQLGVWMRFGQREMPKDKAQPIAHVTPDALYDWLSAPAVWALEVAVLDKGHRRVSGTGNVISIVDWYGELSLRHGRFGEELIGGQ